MFLHKTNILMRALYPSFIWKLGSDQKKIYLTFDDGPIPEVTEFVLETLNKYDAKATFFLIGNNVTQNPNIFNEILTNEHTIGNHTYNHVNGWKTDYEPYIFNFESCNEVIPYTNLFRPPYGRIRNNQAKFIQKTHNIVMWDVLSGDFSSDISPEICLKKSIQYTTAGSIVLFHDSIKASKNMMYTLPRFLEYFKDKGFEFDKIKL